MERAAEACSCLQENGMDDDKTYPEHERMWQNFVKGMTCSTLACAAILILLALFLL